MSKSECKHVNAAQTTHLYSSVRIQFKLTKTNSNRMQMHGAGGLILLQYFRLRFPFRLVSFLNKLLRMVHVQKLVVRKHKTRNLISTKKSSRGLYEKIICTETR